MKVKLAHDGCGNAYAWFECPGCNERHMVRVAGFNKWQFNDDLERPTFSPSILVRYPANPNAIEGFEEWRTERVCHSFVVDGQIQFLGDCTHYLKGQTVELPTIVSEEVEAGRGRRSWASGEEETRNDPRQLDDEDRAWLDADLGEWNEWNKQSDEDEEC